MVAVMAVVAVVAMVVMPVAVAIAIAVVVVNLGGRVVGDGLLYDERLARLGRTHLAGVAGG